MFISTHFITAWLTAISSHYLAAGPQAGGKPGNYLLPKFSKTFWKRQKLISS